MNSNERIFIKLLKDAVYKILVFLIIFFSCLNVVSAAGFKYSDFDFDEFAKANADYWTLSCNGDKKCQDEIIKSQKKFYTKLYSVLAKKEAKGYKIDDKIIISTVFFEYTPSNFNDKSKAYNIDNSDDDGENETSEYFRNETDTVKLLINAMIGYEQVCYGITSATIVEKNEDNKRNNPPTDGPGPVAVPMVKVVEDMDGQNSNDNNENETNEDTEPEYTCTNGSLSGTQCIVFLKRTSLSFLERYFGVGNKESCSTIAHSHGYSNYKEQNGGTKKVVEEGYWEFLEKENYFDKKDHLQHYYATILNKTNHTHMKELSSKEKEEYKEEIISARKTIVNNIKSILKIYTNGTSDKELNDISGNTSYWWPIGSAETSNVNGKLFASGDPVSVRITSPYGYRNHPFHKDYRKHMGLDLGGVGGAGETNIIAAKTGTVVEVYTGCKSFGDINCGGGYGNHVKILHNDGLYSFYGHMHEGTITVKTGDVVSQGQVIGKMGSSGMSTGPHLHFEIRTTPNQASAVDPLEYVDPNNPRPTSLIVYVRSDRNTTSEGDVPDQSIVKEEVCLSLLATGFNEDTVAAIMSNIQAESRFRINAIGDYGTSYGLCQWHAGRWERLKEYSPNSWETTYGQLNFLMYELSNYGSFTYLNGYLRDGNMGASALSEKFCLIFEAPAAKEETCPLRYDSDLLSYVQNGCK